MEVIFAVILVFMVFSLVRLNQAYYAAIVHRTTWEILLYTFILVAILVLIFVAWRRITAILSRMVFVYSLRFRVWRAGGKCRTLHSCLRSFFSVYGGADILITKGEKRYLLKFFPYFIKNCDVHIADEKTAHFFKRSAHLWHAGRAYVVSGRGVPVVNEFGFGRKKINLTMAEEGIRILLLSPSCPKVTVTVANRSEVVDNNYEWHDMTFWYQKSLFKLLEREGVLRCK